MKETNNERKKMDEIEFENVIEKIESSNNYLKTLTDTILEWWVEQEYFSSGYNNDDIEEVSNQELDFVIMAKIIKRKIGK
jgi:hypothetical protein